MRARRSSILQLGVVVLTTAILLAGYPGVRVREAVGTPPEFRSSYVGGEAREDAGQGIAIAPDGSIYVCFLTASLDIPVTPGAWDTTFNGGSYDAGIMKLSSDQSTVLWATYFGGSGTDDGCDALAIAPDGTLWATGSTNSSDFPVVGGFQDHAAGEQDVYLARFSADGSTLLYSTLIGGSGYDFPSGLGLIVATNGDVYLVGQTYSPDFPTTPGVFQETIGGWSDGFIIRIDQEGGLIFSTFMGGQGFEVVSSIAVDEQTSALYVAGSADSPEFQGTAGASNVVNTGLVDIFVAKFSDQGQLSSLSLLGGTRDDYAAGILLDVSGNVIVVGRSESADLPVSPTAIQSVPGSGTNGFVAELTPDLDTVGYLTYVGGSGYDALGSAFRLADGRLVLWGTSAAPDFPLTSDAADTVVSVFDAILMVLSTDLDEVLYSSFFGGAGTEDARGGVLTGNALVLYGLAVETDFPATPGTWGSSPRGNSDMFIAATDLGGSVMCSPGFYSASGFVPCVPAPAGTYVDTFGAVAPIMCPVGTTSPAASTSAAACVPLDSDNDGTPDVDDGCPTLPGPAARRGCPDACSAAPTILGTNGSDHIVGTTGDDVIWALGGNDHIIGNGGDDLICAGDGNDHVLTSDGDDVIDTGAGNDHVTSGAGDDVVDTGDGNDKIVAGFGDDILFGGTGNDKVDGGAGSDTCDAGSGNNQVTNCEA